MAVSLSRQFRRSRRLLDRDSVRGTSCCFRQSRIETLEPRWTLSASPTLAPIADVTLAAGTPLYIALDGNDADGDPLLFTIDSTNDQLFTMLSDSNRSLRIVVENYGEMVFELFENLAPRTAAEIIALAEDGFYDGLIFHRVAKYADGTPFVIQGGDPNGDGTGGPGSEFDDEYDPLLMHTSKGILSMAKSEDDTNGSQFFVTGTATRHLDFNHSVFGYLVEGEAVRQAIQGTPVDANSRPLNDVVMQSVEVFLDQQNGVLVLSAPEGYTGEAQVTVTVSDGNGGLASQSFNVNIVPDTVNDPPYLKPINPIQIAAGGTTVVTLDAIDLEGDAVFYDGVVHPSSDRIQLSMSQTTGVATITASATAGGVYGIYVGVQAVDGSTWDTQAVPVFVTPAAPTSVDLLASSDTGVSSSDDLTNLNNASGRALWFRVNGVVPGATVLLYADGQLIGQALAAADSVVVVTSETHVLADGQHAVTAVQGFFNQAVDIGNSNEVVTLASSPSAALTITVDTALPVVTSEPVTTAVGGVQYVYDVESDAEAAGVARYWFEKSPSGMLINSSTGVITWTPTKVHGLDQEVTVVVEDPAGNQTRHAFMVYINRPPEIWPIGNMQVEELSQLTVEVIATDPDPGSTGPIITFSLDAGAPEEAAIHPVTGLFTWTPTEAQGPGVYTILVRATDGAGATAVEGFTVTVLELNQAPLLDAIADAVVSEGELLEFQATASDPDLPSQTLTYSLAPGSPAGATIDPASGVFQWRPGEEHGDHTFAITVRVTDSYGAVAQQTFHVSVLEVDDPPVFAPIATQFVTAGSSFRLRAEAIDPDPEANAVRYSFDSAVPDGMTIDPTSGEIAWDVPRSHPAGSVFVTVRATELLPDQQQGLSASAIFEVRVSASLPDFITHDQVLGLSNEPSILAAQTAREAVDSLLFAAGRQIRFVPAVPVAPKDDQLFGPRIGSRGGGNGSVPESETPEKESRDASGEPARPSTSGAAAPSAKSLSTDGLLPTDFLSEDDSTDRDELASVELLDAAFGQIADEQTSNAAQEASAA